ncbi:GGDEF domain-containing protein [Nocardioides sp. WS12]|uniref:GGDEF domain-containing protein n=1 Tax=Nocardioides sp. WS12 TaxID=2486272 RepID=UPI0015FA3983|nr:GGDEF domain-containing protein [Nocardioides sp. WS12]
MDTITLRVAFGLVAVCVLALFYGVTYRSTRSSYSAWWCLSLACFILSALLFVLNGTPVQVAANPLGNATGVLGAGCVWAGARSLRGQKVPWWPLQLVPALVLLVSLLDDPVHDRWSGGIAYLLAMTLLIGWSAVELHHLLRERDSGDGNGDQIRFAVTSMAITSGCIAGYYLVRAVVFVVVGPDHPVFDVGFGGQTTTLLTMVLLVVVTFSMSALSHEQQTSDLRLQATRDALTGLLNRAEFFRVVERDLRGRGGRPAALVIADLDRFKDLNDRLGHTAGDEALIAFSESCEAIVGNGGRVGRLGGDEFVLLVPDVEAEQFVGAIATRYGRGGEQRSASFGIATMSGGSDVASAMVAADAALYRAKADGRGRASRAADESRLDS